MAESGSSAVVADIVERAAWTGGQQFFAILLTTSAASVAALPWEIALATAAGAAIVSALTSIVQHLAKFTNLPFWPDVGVRLLKTFIASVLGTIGAEVFDVLTFDWESALNIAAIATIVALGKSVLARNEPRDDSERQNPSTLSAKTYELACVKP